MKNIFFKKFLPGIAWFFVVLILLCIPSRGLPKADTWFNHIYLDKWVHAGLFGVLSFLWMHPIVKSGLSKTKKHITIIIVAITSSIWGLATEYIQKYYIPGREFDWLDWAADSVGILLALIIVIKKRPG
ncbi:MAG: VanZ family protein [Chitinophagaceae bacterium]|nr:VanZ family protein [Chitinophagaceae bacterium]